MKKGLLLTGAAAIMLLASFINDDGWYKYTCVPGKYSVEFPGKPTKETSKMDTLTSGEIINIRMAMFEVSATKVFLSSSTDLSANYSPDADVKEALLKSRDGAMSKMGMKNYVTISRNFSGDMPYIEFVFSGSGLVGKDIIYIINKQEYSIIFINAEDEGITPDGDRFINSFKIIK